MEITKEIILQDILDTQEEIDNLNEEKSILMRNPTENRTRIYLLEGEVFERQDFINKISSFLRCGVNVKLWLSISK